MTYPIAQYSIGQWEIDLSTPDYFQELLKRPDFELVYLVELYPYNKDAVQFVAGMPPIGVNPITEWGFNYNGAIQTVYLSDRGYIDENHVNYKPRTDNAFQFDISVFNGEFTGRGLSFGAIRVLNGDGDYDFVTDYFWAGRNVKVFAGAPDFTRDQFVKVFDGLCANIEYSEDEIIINIQNNEKILENEFVQSLYDGTGGLNGGDDLFNKEKPLLYGEALRITPVLVDPANLVYQVHDGSIQAVDAVYDRGVALTSGGDVSDITAATPTAGQYITQLSGGYIKLGSSPDGQITADAKGDNAGGYVSKCGAIITRLLRTKLGLFNLVDANIDQGAFNALDSVVTGDIGVYITEKTSVSDVVNRILIPLQCYWTYKRDGIITVGVGQEPSNSVFELNANNIIDDEIEVINFYTPSWRINLGYARRWTNQNEIAAGASDAYRDFNQEEYRVITKEDRNIRTLSASADEKTFQSLLVNQADAIEQANRIESLYNKQRKLYRLSVKELLFRVFIGDTITITLNRFGLNDGRDFLITGISEDAETNITELEVWG